MFDHALQINPNDANTYNNRGKNFILIFYYFLGVVLE